jgi:transcriptional regulator with XRE-family HTH domain
MKFYTSADLAQLCRELRERKKMTMEQLATEIGVNSIQQIWAAENDTSSKRDGIRIRIIEQLAGKEVVAGYILRQAGASE